MNRARAVIVVGCLAASAATRGAAQIDGALDVGAGTNRSDRSLTGAVTSFAPSVVFGAGPLQLSGAGVYSDAAGGRWNFQGASGAVLRSPRAGIFRGEVIGEADWTWHHRVQGVTTLAGELRAYVMPSARSVAWVGRGIGAGWSLGRRRPLDRMVMGASAKWGGIQFGLSVKSTTFDLVSGGERSGDSTFTAFADTGLIERRTTYTDATVASAWDMAGMRLDLSVGRRFSRTTPEVLLWGITATRSLLPGIALLASAGRAGSDPVTALPGSRYLVLGLRLSTGPGPGYTAPQPVRLAARRISNRPCAHHGPRNRPPCTASARGRPGRRLHRLAAHRARSRTRRRLARRAPGRRGSTQSRGPDGRRRVAGASRRTAGGQRVRWRGR